MWEESGKEIFWSQIWRSWKIWTRQKSTLKDSMQRKKFFQNKMEILFLQPQMDESNFLKEIKST